MNFSVIMARGRVSTRVNYTISYGPDFAGVREKYAHFCRNTRLSPRISF